MRRLPRASPSSRSNTSLHARPRCGLLGRSKPPPPQLISRCCTAKGTRESEAHTEYIVLCSSALTGWHGHRRAQGVENLFERQERMVATGPVFCDITWGAGGTTADVTMDIAVKMQNEVGGGGVTCNAAPKGQRQRNACMEMKCQGQGYCQHWF